MALFGNKLSLLLGETVPMSADPSSAFEAIPPPVKNGLFSTSGPVSEGPYTPRWLDFGLHMEGAGGFKVPTFSASDLAWQEATPDTRITQGDSDERVVAGLPAGVRWTDNANRDAYSWWSKADPQSNSVQIVSDPNNPNVFALQVKTADKQGTLIPYALQGNEWVPQQQGIRQFHWDTNDDLGGLGPAALVLAAPFAMGGLQALFGAGGASAAEIAAMADVGMGAGGATAAEIAAMADVGMGAGGATAAGGGGMLAAGGAAGGFLESAVGRAVTGGIGNTLINSLIGAGTGLYQDRQARQAADDYFNRTMGLQGDYRQAGLDYAAGLRGLLPELRSGLEFRPANVDTGIARTNIDPVTGQVRFDLNSPYQQARDQYLQAAQGLFGQMRDFNPRTFAQERFSAMQDLLRPQDQLAEQNLMQQLYNKGGFGLTLNQPGAGGGTAAVNPYLNTFLNARQQRDKQLAYDALTQGESYLDNLIRRQQGLFGQGQAIDVAGSGAFTQAQQFSNLFNNARAQQTMASLGLQQNALGAERDAQQRFIEALLGATQQRMSSDAAARQARTDIYGNVIRDIAGRLPWGDWLSGLFGG